MNKYKKNNMPPIQLYPHHKTSKRLTYDGNAEEEDSIQLRTCLCTCQRGPRSYLHGLGMVHALDSIHGTLSTCKCDKRTTCKTRHHISMRGDKTKTKQELSTQTYLTTPL